MSLQRPVAALALCVAALATPGLAAPGLATPGLATPALTTPGLATPALATPGLAPPALPAARAPACADDRAQFVLPDGTARSVTVEVADTPDSRARGLMFRTALPPDHGMLFIYEAPAEVAFWMRNTLIPLDMVFIDPAGRVAHVAAGAKPHDETPVPGAAPGDPDPARLMVLEVAAGEAARLGLAPGAVLAHPRLPQDIAALPCP